ncbi:toxin-antitoxin system YwqK family antitoxin [Pedobacter sp. KLB.chiD]|uniref:toxin-antitoxin system YwqK family antitoxin n=1 Tax=Pedobacter sp. KLB.chiD TaxID=3387402 RepID=UPI00399AE12D
MRVNMDDDSIQYAGIDEGGGNMWNYNGVPFTGIIEEFYDNGNLVGEIECKNGYTDGLQTEYYENGQINEEYYLKYNRRYGTYKHWDENGVLLVHLVFDNDGNIINRILG